MAKAQSSNRLLAIRPKCFGFNEETAASNSFQKLSTNDDPSIAKTAIEEFDKAIAILLSKGIDVRVFEDSKAPCKPDAVFPNNWFSTHEKQVVLYPMKTENRRLERRMDIVNAIIGNRKLFDLSTFEKDEKFLEGTGSIVFDHSLKMAFTAISPRINLEVLEKLCNEIGYNWFMFSTKNQIYHTNVLMSIGSQYSLICKDQLVGDEYAELIKLLDPHKDIIEITTQQMRAFCGNVLEVRNSDEKSFIIMSGTAFSSFSRIQLKAFNCEPIVVSIPTIEMIGGGGIRCMLAELF